MFTRSGQIAEGSELDADVCVVGSGPAGLALARSLSGAARRVVVLESGGLSFDARAQRLAEAEAEGAPMLAAHISRYRGFGGTSRRWAGYVQPLDPEDFAARPWIPHSGWPIGADDLAPWYARALDLLEVGAHDWSSAEWAEGSHALSRIPITNGRLALINLPRVVRRHLGSRFRAEIAADKNVTVVLNAHAAEIETDDAARAAVTIRALRKNGQAFRVRAGVFVIAAGGIENSRLLLASNRARPAGLGNDHDQVGRYFMNHPSFPAAWFHVPPDAGALRARWTRYVGFGQRLQLTPKTMEAEQTAKFTARLYPVAAPGTGPFDRSDGLKNLSALLGLNPAAALGRDHLRRVGRVLGDIGGIARDLRRRFTEPFTSCDTVCVIAETEQVPNPDSRVRLSGARDALSQPVAQFDWRLNGLDKHTVRRGVEILGEELARAGLGPLYTPEWISRSDFDYYPGGDWGHHAGTTRMSAEPSGGVVDHDCRVHGMENLYVVGSSVFSTEGAAPPTLTVLALALRLATKILDRC